MSLKMIFRFKKHQSISNLNSTITTILCFIFFFLTNSSSLEAQSTDTFTPAEKAEISKLVRQYIKRNPEIILEALEDIQEQEKVQKEKEQRTQLKLNEKFIERDIVIFVIISFKKNIRKPIKIDINNILKKFSFLLNLPENPIIINDNITIKNGFSNSDI